MLNDSASPLKIDGAVGIEVYYVAGDRSASGRYVYKTFTSVSPLEPIVAYELRVYVLDAFGRHITTLGDTFVVDFKAPRLETSEWRISSETDASRAFASVVYVSSARTAGGKVYSIDRASVLEQIRRVSGNVTDADLEIKK